jgi:phosphopantothenoylcysteine decarboxylase/phosphopantothenate--cysteine ligase
VSACESLLGPRDLDGVPILITAGPTHEAVDPVRFLGNRSSGKQGYALAIDAALRGADVTLVSTVERWAPASVRVQRVVSAAEMEQAVLAAAPGADVVVMAAAVADFRPKEAATQKIKKGDGVPDVVLEPTPDILAALGARKPAGQVLVGFAAETHMVRDQALAKLTRKNLDLIVANDVTSPGAGFEHETNSVDVLSARGSVKNVPLTDKRDVARIVLDAVVDLLGASS